MARGRTYKAGLGVPHVARAIIKSATRLISYERATYACVGCTLESTETRQCQMQLHGLGRKAPPTSQLAGFLQVFQAHYL